MQQLVKPKRPLSPVHAMLGMLEMQKDAKHLNEIVNHPDVYDWVRGNETGRLDLTNVIDDGAVCLLGKHGGLVFVCMQPGLWEVHSQFLKEGRGAWALDCARACLMWLFSRTDAVEVITRCPKGNIAAKALAKACHLSHQFTNPAGWVMDGKPIAADIYSLTVQDWMRTAQGLEERGRWFHDRLADELATPEPPHPDDPTHDRYVGAACEMVLGGQPQKAALFYNRYSLLGGYAPIVMIDDDPVTFNVGTALVTAKDGTLTMRPLPR